MNAFRLLSVQVCILRYKIWTGACMISEFLYGRGVQETTFVGFEKRSKDKTFLFMLHLYF